MRILCCLNHDIVSSAAFNLLLPALAGHEVHVALSERVGKANAPDDEPAERRELRAAEQGMARGVLFPLVERGGFADDGERWLTFGELPRLRGIPVSPLSSPNSADGLAFLRGVAPDLIVSLRYGAIFRGESIAVPRLGVINLHAGLLPSYRGVLASFRALMHGDTEVGCTLHYIQDGTIDTGAIIATARVPVDTGRSMYGHVLSLYPKGVALIADAIERLSRGETPTTRPQGEGGAYYTYPTADEWREFARRGWRVVDIADLDALFRRFMPAGSGQPRRS